tara:strand:+ start:209 stop:511 length:303 start_codon:yes stop_codon:yes gene_type:complete
MKQALIVFFMITNMVSAQFIPQDKLLHMGGSYVISSGVSAVIYNKTNNEKKALVYGLTTAIAAGLAKEIYDRKHGNPDIKDMVANSVGATLGIITIRIAI